MNPNTEAQNHALKLRIGQLDTELRNAQSALLAVGFPRQGDEPLAETFRRAWEYAVSMAHKAQEQAQSRQQTIDYLTRALSSLLTEAGERPHSNPAELVTQIRTVMRRAPKPMTGIGDTDFERTESLISRRYAMMRNACDPVWSEIPYTIRVPVIRAVSAELNGPAPLTEEEARRWALMSACHDCSDADVASMTFALLACSRDEIPPEVRRCHACGGSGSVGAQNHDRDGFPHEQPCPVCTLTPEEEAEIIASAPGTIAPGQRPISARPSPSRELVEALYQLGRTLTTKEQRSALRAVNRVVHDGPLTFGEAITPIDPDSGTRATSAEMAVVLGTGDDAGPASEEMDANEEIDQ